MAAYRHKMQIAIKECNPLAVSSPDLQQQVTRLKQRTRSTIQGRKRSDSLYRSRNEVTAPPMQWAATLSGTSGSTQFQTGVHDARQAHDDE